MEDGFREALLTRFECDKRNANVPFNGHRQAVTGPPVIAEGYQDNGRLSNHYNSGRSICMESYPIRFLTARQERTEVVTRAGLVFSMRRGLFLYPRTAGAACCTAIR